MHPYIIPLTNLSHIYLDSFMFSSNFSMCSTCRFEVYRLKNSFASFPYVLDIKEPSTLLTVKYRVHQNSHESFLFILARDCNKIAIQFRSPNLHENRNKDNEKANTNLPIKTLKLPDTLSFIINLVPPPQPNQYPSTDILHNPEVERCEEHSDDKDNDEVVHEKR